MGIINLSFFSRGGKFVMKMSEHPGKMQSYFIFTNLTII